MNRSSSFMRRLLMMLLRAFIMASDSVGAGVIAVFPSMTGILRFQGSSHPPFTGLALRVGWGAGYDAQKLVAIRRGPPHRHLEWMTVRVGAAGRLQLGGSKVFQECWNFVKHPKETRAGEDLARRGAGLGMSWVRLEKDDRTCLAGVERLLGGADGGGWDETVAGQSIWSLFGKQTKVEWGS